MLVASVVIGFAISLSVFFFLEAAMRSRPAFDQVTVARLGPAVAAFFFALVGPVLVLRQSLAYDRRPARWPLTIIVFATFWAGLVGIVALETGRLVILA